LPQLKVQELTCILHAIMRTGLRMHQCPTADQLFTSAASLTQPHLDRFTFSQCLNLLQAFTGFVPSGCGAPECCISIQRILVAACRSKSLKSGSGHKNGHFANLDGTVSGDSAAIQCEESENHIGQTALDDNNDVETSTQTLLNLTESGLSHDLHEELLTALASTLVKNGVTAEDPAQLARVCGLPQNGSTCISQLYQALTKITSRQMPNSCASQQHILENMETLSIISSDSDSIQNSSRMSTWNNFSSQITPDVLRYMEEPTRSKHKTQRAGQVRAETMPLPTRSKHKTQSAGQVHAETMPLPPPRLSEPPYTSGPATIGEMLQLSFQQPGSSSLSSVPIPSFVRTNRSASSRCSLNEDPGLHPKIPGAPLHHTRPMTCQTNEPVCSRAEMPVMQNSQGDQHAAARFFSDRAFDSMRSTLNCEQGITFDRNLSNQVFLPQRSEQRTVVDTDHMQCQTQASTVYSTMPLDSHSSAVSNFTARPIHAVGVAMQTRHSTQITAKPYDGGPLLESVAV